MEMVKFPSIEQFRHVIRNVEHKAQCIGYDSEAGKPVLDRLARKPTLSFLGTVKLHGTNAGIVYTGDEVQFQSRERVLTSEADNAGFYAHFANHPEAVKRLRDRIVSSIPDVGFKRLAVYGEWCGGNIQKGVAISGLPKMFVVFAVKLDEDWVDGKSFLQIPFDDVEASIYSISRFPVYYTAIDFENPSDAQNHLVGITEQVEAECPVGQYFGNKGVGEGVVWRCLDAGYESSNYWFKVKGEKHSESKVKTLAEVDVEVVKAVADFVEKSVTEARLEHGLQNLVSEQMKPFDMSSLGDFLRWVFNDILKEEADTLDASGLDRKSVSGHIAVAAKRWFIARLNQEAFVQ